MESHFSQRTREVGYPTVSKFVRESRFLTGLGARFGMTSLFSNSFPSLSAVGAFFRLEEVPGFAVFFVAAAASGIASEGVDADHAAASEGADWN